MLDPSWGRTRGRREALPLRARGRGPGRVHAVDRRAEEAASEARTSGRVGPSGSRPCLPRTHAGRAAHAPSRSAARASCGQREAGARLGERSSGSKSNSRVVAGLAVDLDAAGEVGRAVVVEPVVVGEPRARLGDRDELTGARVVEAVRAPAAPRRAPRRRRGALSSAAPPARSAGRARRRARPGGRRPRTPATSTGRGTPCPPARRPRAGRRGAGPG